VTSRSRRQGGYTLVETIVAITIGAIVMAAIFPVFFLLYRVEVSWGDSTQARATGLLAEESLLRDLRAYHVQTTGYDTLVLIPLADTGQQIYSVTYSVDSGRLMRTVSGSPATIVAHGIKEFTAYPCSLGVVRVAIVTLGTTGTAVSLEPRLSIAPRNQGCQ
jgi:prepilin-type N-terminal cleavage/methylation domain-containing protein